MIRLRGRSRLSGAFFLAVPASLAMALSCSTSPLTPVRPSKTPSPPEILTFPVGALEEPGSRKEALKQLADIEAGRRFETGAISALRTRLEIEFRRAPDPPEKADLADALARLAIIEKNLQAQVAWRERQAQLSRRDSGRLAEARYLLALAYARAGRPGDALDLAVPNPSLHRETPELERRFQRLVDAIASGSDLP